MSELKVPEVGESITEVVVGQWLVVEGEFANKDDVVVVIETDKANVELPAPADGVVKKVLVGDGENAQVGDVIGHFEEGVPASTGASRSDRSEAGATKADSSPSSQTAANDVPAVMPAAQRVLAEHGLEAGDVKATGPGGRLLKEDVLRHVAGESQDPVAEPVAARNGMREEEAVPLTPIRKRIAERLVQAQQQAALLTTFNEIDMGPVKALRKQHQEAFQKKHGIKLGFMSFFVKAAIEALKEYPQINAELRGQELVYHNYYDIGVAVGGGKGLVVPVVRNAERLSFASVEKTIAELATRAQQQKLTLEELQGGTFTISNGGVYGSLLSTPIVNPPQSGILGLHAIQDRPAAVNGEVVIRPMMYVALTYDHRIVDGREAVQFLLRIKHCVEDPARILLEI